ncbi:MAG: signal recognition particle-docking protein FtsY [Proteobacteria bacterium]|jgi:fused signal recognition particle receptor|nr:signal recognition particle-docking protein FtsY [Pseudomonadota bacterium]
MNDVGMTPSGQMALFGLVFLMGVLFLAIVVVVFRSKKNSQVSSRSVASESTNLEAVSQETIPEPKSVTLKEALTQTQGHFWGRISSVFSNSNPQFWDELEEVLYTSDLGPQTVERLLNSVKDQLSRTEQKDLETVKSAIKSEFLQIFQGAGVQEPETASQIQHLSLQAQPTVWLIVGVNGVGKTTSIGKLAAKLASEGKKVLVAAGDTFRAAAGNQLRAWTERAQVEIFSPEGVKDPSAVAFDAVTKAKAQNYDVVLIDTAGRLHTQAHLMDELKKVKRVIQKIDSAYPHETLIVLDANSGQNALLQAKQFHEAVQLTGVILTKMDGTAKGGVAVGLSYELKIPIRLIGIGEKIEDLRPFSPREFVDSVI